MENITLDVILQVANTGALAFIVVWFSTGKIVSNAHVEKMLKAQMNVTTKLTNEISEKIEKSVKVGVLEAYREMNGKKEK